MSEKKVNSQTEVNRDKARYLRNRSTSRNFIKKGATLEDIEELKNLIVEREAELLKRD